MLNRIFAKLRDWADVGDIEEVAAPRPTFKKLAQWANIEVDPDEVDNLITASVTSPNPPRPVSRVESNTTDIPDFLQRRQTGSLPNASGTGGPLSGVRMRQSDRTPDGLDIPEFLQGVIQRRNRTVSDPWDRSNDYRPTQEGDALWSGPAAAKVDPEWIPKGTYSGFDQIAVFGQKPKGLSPVYSEDARHFPDPWDDNHKIIPGDTGIWDDVPVSPSTANQSSVINYLGNDTSEVTRLLNGLPQPLETPMPYLVPNRKAAQELGEQGIADLAAFRRLDIETNPALSAEQAAIELKRLERQLQGTRNLLSKPQGSFNQPSSAAEIDASDFLRQRSRNLRGPEQEIPAFMQRNPDDGEIDLPDFLKRRTRRPLKAMVPPPAPKSWEDPAMLNPPVILARDVVTKQVLNGRTPQQVLDDLDLDPVNVNPLRISPINIQNVVDEIEGNAPRRQGSAIISQMNNGLNDMPQRNVAAEWADALGNQIANKGSRSFSEITWSPLPSPNNRWGSADSVVENIVSQARTGPKLRRSTTPALTPEDIAFQRASLNPGTAKPVSQEQIRAAAGRSQASSAGSEAATAPIPEVPSSPQTVVTTREVAVVPTEDGMKVVNIPTAADEAAENLPWYKKPTHVGGAAVLGLGGLSVMNNKDSGSDDEAVRRYMEMQRQQQMQYPGYY